MSNKVNINFLPGAKSTLKILVVLVFLIVALSFSSQLYRYFYLNEQSNYLIDFVNLDLEANLPTWINTLLLLCCSALLFIVSYVNHKSEKKYFVKWILLAIIFFLFATDEIINLHEQMINPLRRYFNTGGFFYYAWIIPALIFLVIFLIGYLKFIMHLPVRTKVLFLISGFVFVLGAIGFEAIGGNYIYVYDFQDFNYVIITTLEEFIEMIGLSLFIYSLLDYLKTEYKNLQLSFIINKKD